MIKRGTSTARVRESVVVILLRFSRGLVDFSVCRCGKEGGKKGIQAGDIILSSEKRRGLSPKILGLGSSVGRGDYYHPKARRRI